MRSQGEVATIKLVCYPLSVASRVELRFTYPQWLRELLSCVKKSDVLMVLISSPILRSSLLIGTKRDLRGSIINFAIESEEQWTSRLATNRATRGHYRPKARGHYGSCLRFFH